MPNDPLLVIALVLVAAVFHAWWNKMLAEPGQQITKAQLLVTMYIIGGALLFYFFAKRSVIDVIQQSSGYLALSAVGHVFYYLGLAQSYRHAEFSAVFGVMRGFNPIFIALGAFLFQGEQLTMLALFAILLVAVGVSLLKGSAISDKFNIAFAWAIFTGLGAAVSFLADGSGTKQAGDPAGFFGCSLVIGATISLVILSFMPDAWERLTRPQLAKAVAMGGLSVLTYSIGIWAVLFHPFGKIAALRETTVLFALFFGRQIVKEPLTIQRVLGCLAVAGGAGCLVWLR